MKMCCSHQSCKSWSTTSSFCDYCINNLLWIYDYSSDFRFVYLPVNHALSLTLTKALLLPKMTVGAITQSNVMNYFTRPNFLRSLGDDWFKRKTQVFNRTKKLTSLAHQNYNFSVEHYILQQWYYLMRRSLSYHLSDNLLPLRDN